MRGEQMVVRHHQHHRCEIARKIPRQIRYQRGVDRGGSARDEQRVTVSGRLGRRLGADVAAGAGPILDDEWLAEDLRHFRRHRARDDVRAAAGREWHDDPDRLGREALCQRAIGQGERDGEKTLLQQCETS